LQKQKRISFPDMCLWSGPKNAEGGMDAIPYQLYKTRKIEEKKGSWKDEENMEKTDKKEYVK